MHHAPAQAEEVARQTQAIITIKVERCFTVSPAGCMMHDAGKKQSQARRNVFILNPEILTSEF
jgi:hypothetical protein